jgi:hypothetical protein
MNDENTPKDSAKMGEAMTPDEFSDILEEIENQPVWRSRADKEMDYYDGNQLKSELLEKQKALGIPPAVENVIQPAINALIGMEAKTRKDWRVSPDGDPQGQDVADALNYKLNQAERHSAVQTWPAVMHSRPRPVQVSAGLSHAARVIRSSTRTSAQLCTAMRFTGT